MGTRAAIVPALQQPGTSYLTQAEEDAVIKEERSLLRDCDIIPPKHPRKPSTTPAPKPKHSNIITKSRPQDSTPPTEDTSLLTSTTSNPAKDDPSLPYGGNTREDIERQWEQAVKSGLIKTTYRREFKVIGRYSRSLILTFLLQYSLPLASIFAVSRIGTLELGAISLATMTANITGYAIFQGLSTSLDTLCAQAYGSGNKKLVGLQLQRMILFLWCCCVPIGFIWFSGTRILEAIVPEKETAALAGRYLKIVFFGAPGYSAFEAGKRYVQAQGDFSATLYILLFIAPFNAFLHWLFVWHLGMGFTGAPLAVAITENMLPLFLFLYVYFVGGRDCWGGFSRAALKNWGPMIKLALPGLLMVLAEYLAFEILTLSASLISATHLAAQSVLSTICSITFQFPFPISVAASTRIANLIGASLSDAAKVSSKVGLVAAAVVGVVNSVLLLALRKYIPYVFTNDPDVVDLVTKVLPLCAAFQLFDALAASCNGILRGLGRQEFGGYVNLVCYYAIAIPISFGLGFGLKLGLAGLWTGPAVALGLVAAIEGVFIYYTNWEKAVEAAQKRNLQG
jgi:putative MATE family efflux protein